VGTDQFTRLGGVDKAGYTLVFFHTALVQAVCSGFVGGQLGEGSIRDGTKHAAIMLTVAYVLFLVVSAPVASVAAPGPEPGDDRVTVDSASLSAGGYVAVYAGGTDGTLLGRSAYLDPGTHEDVVVDLDRPVPGRGSIVLVAHRETTGDDTFDYTGPPYRPSTTQPDRPYTAFSGSGPEAVELDVGDRGG
jgi:flagellar protein FlaJ